MKLITFILIIFQASISFAQNEGFFINYPKQSDTTEFDIPFHYIDNEEVIYMYRKTNFYLGYDLGCKTYLVKSDKRGEVIKKIDLSIDTLNAFSSYGNILDDKIQAFTFAKSSSNSYLIYRLFNKSFEVEDSYTFKLDNFSFEGMYDRMFYIELYRAPAEDYYYVIINVGRYESGGAHPRYIAMSFDNSGSFHNIKEVNNSNVVDFSIDSNNNLELVSYKGYKSTYDNNLDFVKEVKLSNPASKNDTLYGLWNSILQVDGKIIRFGKTTINYNVDDPETYYSLSGKGISEVNKAINVKGKLELTELPMSLESDGTARYSGSLFYRDGFYYSLFEYQNYNMPFPSPNTLYVTKYDDLLNIVEETHFVLEGNYRLFLEWADLSENLQLSASGFYYNTENQSNGAFILGLNLDGSQPSLSKENTLFKAVIKVEGNPTSDYLNLKVESSFNKYEVRIFDLSGKIINSVNNLNTKYTSIPIQNLECGTFIFQIFHENKLLGFGKFVKV